MADTIVVTGAAGYIGSHTLIELLKEGKYTVLAIDNYSNSKAETYNRVRQITGKEFETAEIDLCNYGALLKGTAHLDKIAGVIHFAAYKSVPESVAKPLLYYHNNLETLTNVLRLCEEKTINRFIFSSSCSVYGNTSDLPVTETTPVQKAESPYAHTKQIGEDIVNAFALANPGFNAVLLRYFNPVGAHPTGLIGELPQNRPNNLVPIITQTAVGKNQLTVFGNDYSTRDGSCIRDYIHVCDIAEAHTLALDYLSGKKDKVPVSLFNLGTGHGVSVLEAIKAFEKVSGRLLPYHMGPRRAGDVEAIYADNRLARTELGWNPKNTIDDMMLTAWKWQQTIEKESTST